MNINKLILFLLLVSIGCEQVASTVNIDKDSTDIRQVLAQSASDWTKGDLEAYMNAYWESEDLKFIGSSGVTYGWQQTLTNYKKGYPTAAHTGTLTFDIIHVDFLAKDVYSVIGKYKLERTVGEANGIFSLLFKRIDGQWKIIVDHSE
ncbi:MAG: DUF4440 domain-containing protein [Flavobacteriaceae bacterium]|nr:MAG: DUF4440 domain-containing protein [Flavobacteriaceae bacterium]